jgi:hypothetical protein
VSPSVTPFFWQQLHCMRNFFNCVWSQRSRQVITARRDGVYPGQGQSVPNSTLTLSTTKCTNQNRTSHTHVSRIAHHRSSRSPQSLRWQMHTGNTFYNLLSSSARFAAACTAFIIVARRPDISRECTPAMVVPPGEVTSSFNWPGWRPLSKHIFAPPYTAQRSCTEFAKLTSI